MNYFVRLITTIRVPATTSGNHDMIVSRRKTIIPVLNLKDAKGVAETFDGLNHEEIDGSVVSRVACVMVGIHVPFMGNVDVPIDQVENMSETLFEVQADLSLSKQEVKKAKGTVQHFKQDTKPFIHEIHGKFVDDAASALDPEHGSRLLRDQY